MKRRKKTPSSESESESLSESDAESDLRLITLLDPTRTIEGDDALAVDGGEVEGETEESLDKSFLSRDVEKERQITFAEIENANR